MRRAYGSRRESCSCRRPTPTCARAPPADAPIRRPAALQGAEYFLDQRARLIERMRADLVLFVGNAAEQSVERLGGHVVVEVGILSRQQAKLRGLARILVVLGGEAQLGRLGGHHRLEFRRELGAGGTAE